MTKTKTIKPILSKQAKAWLKGLPEIENIGSAKLAKLMQEINCYLETIESENKILKQTHGKNKLNEFVHPKDVSSNLSERLIAISRFSSELNACRKPADIYKLLGDAVHDLCGVIVTVTDYEETTNTFGTAYHRGLEKYLAPLKKIAGYDPLKKRANADDLTPAELDAFISGKMSIVPEGLYGYSLRKIPRMLCKSVEKLLGIRIIYSKGFHFEGKRYGSISLLSDRIIPHDMLAIIESFGENATLVLHRLIIEQRIAESEKKYRQMVDTAKEGIWRMDKDSNTTFVNKRMAEMLDYKIEEMLGKKIWFFIHPDERSDNEIKNADRKKGNSDVYERCLQRKDGGLIWVIVSASPLMNDEGIFEGSFAMFTDITERKLIQQALMENELKYRLLAENTRDVIWTMDLNLKFTYVSPSSTYLTGLTAEEQMNRSIEEFIPQSSLEMILKVFIEEMAAENDATSDPHRNRILEFEEYTKEGETIWVEGQMSFLRDARGKAIGIVGVSRDITSRKLNELKVQVSENALRTTIDSISDSLHVIGKDYKIELYNNAFINWCLKLNTSDNILGKNLIEICPFLTIRAMQEYEQVFTDGQIRISEETLFVENIEIITETRKIPIFENNQVVRVLTIIRDISDSQKLEKQIRSNEIQLRSIMGNTPDIIFRMNTDLDILYLNPAVEREFGISLQKTRGKNFKTLDLNENTLKNWCNAISEAINTTLPVIFIISYPTESGLKYYTGRVIPEIDSEQKVISVLSILRDITEIKKAEAQVLNMNVELEKRVIERTASLEAANKEMESFTYSVSHDLRTPLRALDGFANILLEDYQIQLDEEGKMLLMSIISNTHKMGKLIDNLLEFSRAGKSELRMQKINMKELFLSVSEELVTPEFKKRTKIKIHPLPIAWGDEKMIRQVLINLIENALKYSTPKPIIEIEAGANINEEKIVYYIRDNGVGFEMKYVNKLFNVFQRLHAASEFEGTGVGLAIVKQIIQCHGGKVWAESEVDNGSAFYFSLPLKNDSQTKNISKI
jgi:PAS domain S-box-containing protein